MDFDLPADRLDALLSVNRNLASIPVPTTTKVEPGQIWRAHWDDVLEFVFVDAVLDGARNLVRVAPVRWGVEDADDSAIILSDGTNPLATAFAVWPSLVTEIAEVVLDRWITALDSFDSLASIRQAADIGTLRRGLPILNESSPRHHERVFLELAMQALSLVADVPAGSGKLETLLAGVATAAVSSVLEVSPRIALQILRGELFIDRDQARRLALALERDPQELLEANPAAPDELIAAMTTLERGASVRALARKQRSSESRAFSDALRGTYALAARGEGTSRDWNGRIDRFFSVALSA